MVVQAASISYTSMLHHQTYKESMSMYLAITHKAIKYIIHYFLYIGKLNDPFYEIRAHGTVRLVGEYTVR